MLHRIWFNRGTKNPNETWVIESADGTQTLAAQIEIRAIAKLPSAVSHLCPQAWIEVDGELVVDDHSVVLI